MEDLMLKKNTLAAGLATALAASGLASWPGATYGSEQPPLAGVFADNFTLLEEPVPAPQAPMGTDSGESITLSAFEGQVVLLNFWATWCKPCVREMPSLDRLQAALSPEGLAVVAVSQDRAGLKAVEPFFLEAGLEHLGIYLDPKGKLWREFGVRGLPTTYLIDRQGRLIGAMEGPAEWDEEDAVALIRFYLEQGSESEEADDEPVQTSG